MSVLLCPPHFLFHPACVLGLRPPSLPLLVTLLSSFSRYLPIRWQVGCPVSHTGSLGPPFNLCSCHLSGDWLPYSWSTILVHLVFGGFPMPIPSFLLSSLISKLWRHSSPIPTPHVMGDFLLRLVALKAVDPTFLKTTMITGPVALCVPPFDKLGLSLHFVVGPPVLVEFLPLFSFCYLLIRWQAGRPVSHTGSLDPLFFALFALVTFLGISTLLLVNHTGSPSVWWVPHAYPLFSVPFPFSSLLSFSFPLLSSLISKLWRHSSPIPTPHVLEAFFLDRWH